MSSVDIIRYIVVSITESTVSFTGLIFTLLQSVVMGLAYVSTGIFRSVTPLFRKLVLE